MPETYAYLLTVPGSGASGSPASGAAGGVSRPYATSAGRGFLGFGLLAPFRRDQKGDFAAGAEAELIASCVAQVLGTRCAAVTPGGTSQGEIPWRPAFGSRLYTLLHRNIDDPVTRQLARVYAADALERWEPRFKLKAVGVEKRTSTPSARDADTLFIGVVGDIIRANAPGNQVIIADARVDLEVL